MKELADKIRKQIGELLEPRLQWNIEELNLIKEVTLTDNKLFIRIELIEDDYEKREAFRKSVLEKLEGYSFEKKEVRIEKVYVSAHSLKDVKKIIMVASGKGGVGKSTIAVNLAAVLSQRGLSVGILDADIYGPSIPVLLNAHSKPQVIDNEMLLPVKAHGMKIISMGNLFPRKKAIAWRGQLVSGTILQFLQKVSWGRLDYLIVDLPPGTGDVQLTITKAVQPNGVIIVSTPQQVAREDVVRCISMFKDMNIPIIGMLENMTSWVCEHCAHVQPIFTGSSESWDDLTVLGRLPLDKEVWRCSEKGVPYIKDGSRTKIDKVFNYVADILEFDGKSILKKQMDDEVGSFINKAAVQLR